MDKSVTEKIIEYLLENKINIEEISKDLGISKEKLLFKNNVDLSAEEFLDICSYLHIKPENFNNN